MGSPYRYSPWQPITINGTAPFAKPLYYGNLFIATALAGGGKQVVSLINETNLVAYGIYGEGAGLSSIAVVNLHIWNSTQQEADRPSMDLALPQVEGISWSNAEVRRLMAPGAEVKSSVTFAGRLVDDNGKLEGKETVESVGDEGMITVPASEAVLITL